MPRTLGVLVVTLAMTGVLLHSQEQQPQQPAQEGPVKTFTQRTEEVVAPTTVMDKDGNYVQGLKPAEFEVYDNDKLQNIRVDEIYAPISLVVAIQANDKVDAILPKIQRLGTMLQNMVAGEAGEVALLAFDHRLQKIQDFTSDPSVLEAALKKIKPGSSTSRLNDAVEEATRMLRSRPQERRRVILLISESRDHGSEGKLRETLTSTQVGNVMIYSLNMSRMFAEFSSKPRYPRPDPIPPTARNIPGGGPQTPDSAIQMTGGQGYGANFIPVFVGIFKSVKEIFVDNPVEVFTKYTGGREIPFLSQKSLETAAAEIGREIHNQYLIAYNPNNKEEGGFHTIRVVVKRRGLEVRTRPGYWLAAVVQ